MSEVWVVGPSPSPLLTQDKEIVRCKVGYLAEKRDYRLAVSRRSSRSARAAVVLAAGGASLVASGGGGGGGDGLSIPVWSRRVVRLGRTPSPTLGPPGAVI